MKIQTRNLVITIIGLTYLLLFGVFSYASDKDVHKIQRKDSLQYNDSVSLKVDSIPNNSTFEVKLIHSQKSDSFNKLLPLFALLFGFGLNRGYDYILDRKRFMKEGEKWKSQLQGLVQPIINQKANIIQFVNDFKDQEMNSPHLITNHELNCEIFSSLDKGHLLKYVKQIKREDRTAVDFSNRIHGFISSLRFISFNITDKYNTYSNKISIQTETLSIYLDELYNTFIQLKVLCNSQDVVYFDLMKPFKSIESLFETFLIPHISDGDYELFSLQSEFIDPLRSIIQPIFEFPIYVQMNDQLSKCNREIVKIRREREYLKENFKQIESFLIKSETNLEKILTDFNSNKNINS